MRKKRISFLILLIIMLSTLMSMLTACSSSEKIPIPKVEDNVYIYDEDNVIDDDVEETLNEILVDLQSMHRNSPQEMVRFKERSS